ncbi:MAG: SDR family oxidoreductase [Actinomycetes bacterium]
MSTPDAAGALAGRVALVTGAARNIGAASALAIAAAGGRVLATDVEPDGLAATAERLRAAHGDHAVTTRVADLADATTADDLVATCLESHGRLDVIVHAAVDEARGRVEDLTPEQHQHAFAVNVGAAAWLLRAALPHLPDDGASVVLFSSVQAHRGRWGESLYGATKAAIEGLTRHLAVELGPRRVRVNAISPGWVTETHTPSATERATYPLGRLGTMADIASVVVFLASDATSWMTGAVVNVDGGLSVRHPVDAVRLGSEAARPQGQRSWIRRVAGRTRHRRGPGSSP